MIFIKNMIEYAKTKNGINYNLMIEYCNNYAADKRYKPFILASTTSGKSGILKYRGYKYYWYIINGFVEVEKTW